MVLPPKPCVEEPQQPIELRKKPICEAFDKAREESLAQAAQAQLERINWNAAGIDVGATSHFVAVPADRAPEPVREFPAFTADLEALADWLTQCGIKSIAMESGSIGSRYSNSSKAAASRLFWSMPIT